MASLTNYLILKSPLKTNKQKTHLNIHFKRTFSLKRNFGTGIDLPGVALLAEHIQGSGLSPSLGGEKKVQAEGMISAVRIVLNKSANGTVAK